MSAREALRICLRREHLRRTLRIALVVGTIVTLINQADVMLGDEATTGTWIKAALNYCAPVIVSNLGLLAGKRAEARAAPPPASAPPTPLSAKSEGGSFRCR